MTDVANWIASAATMIAAIMTAANLGTRITGWGFVVFTIGSIAWTFVGLTDGQMSLAITNGFLLVVNIIGIWRWLGRQARYENGSLVASRQSRVRQHIPSLFSAGSLIGADVYHENGDQAGTVIDAMLCCKTQSLNYVVLSQGGVAGAGETLRAVSGEHFNFDGDKFVCNLDALRVKALPEILPHKWPASVTEAQTHA